MGLSPAGKKKITDAGHSNYEIAFISLEASLF